MTTAPDGVTGRAWRAVLSEEVPPPGTEGRDVMPNNSADDRELRRDGTPLSRPVRDDVADAMRCPTQGCGDALAGGGAARGWVLVRVVGSGDPPRRYCSGSCATKGIAHIELGNHRPDPTPATVTPLRPVESTAPRAYRRFTEADIQDCVTRYQQGQSLSEIGSATGRTKGSIRSALERAGVEFRPRGASRAHTEGATA